MADFIASSTIFPLSKWLLFFDEANNKDVLSASYICIYMYVCTYVCILRVIIIFFCMCVCMYVCMLHIRNYAPQFEGSMRRPCMYFNVCMYVRQFIYKSVNKNLCIYVCMYI